MISSTHVITIIPLPPQTNQRLRRPGQKPRDRHARKQRREFLCANRELLIHRRKTQRQVQVIPKPVHEVLVKIGHRLLHAWIVPDEIIAALARHAIAFVLLEESDHLSRRQDAVQILQKALILHLRVGENESYLNWEKKIARSWAHDRVYACYVWSRILQFNLHAMAMAIPIPQ